MLYFICVSNFKIAAGLRKSDQATFSKGYVCKVSVHGLYVFARDIGKAAKICGIKISHDVIPTPHFVY